MAREKESGFADSYIAVTTRDKNLDLASFNTNHFVKLGAELYPFEDHSFS
ncbi:hypothetical protein AGMMS50255_7140 [Spirochaetia bacterium]|nr:hypothetical protein AGMMS50255_7140 [Spirochaetia bacterium]